VNISESRLSVCILVALLASCVGTPAVTYKSSPKRSDAGYRFVIPRTVVKVSQGKGASGSPVLALTPVPVVYDSSGKLLPVYSVLDNTGGWSLVSTSITNVKYADYLIIQSIGTQVTDNRKDAIAAVVALAGAAGLFAGLEAKAPCPREPPWGPLNDFVIDDLMTISTAAIPAPGNSCWGYKITEIKETDPDSRFTFESDPIPVDTRVSWFPYPACRAVTISVFPCDTAAASCVEPASRTARFASVVSVADGTGYRRVALPQKGKVDMHSDFCVADSTSEASPLSGDYALISEAIKDVKGLKAKK
jgi:hypothetical protein